MKASRKCHSARGALQAAHRLLRACCWLHAVCCASTCCNCGRHATCCSLFLASCFSYVCCMLHAVCSLVCAACRLPLAACRLRKMGAKLWCRTRHACPEQHSRWQLHMHPIVFWWLPPTPIPAPWAVDLAVDLAVLCAGEVRELEIKSVIELLHRGLATTETGGRNNCLGLQLGKAMSERCIWGFYSVAHCSSSKTSYHTMQSAKHFRRYGR